MLAARQLARQQFARSAITRSTPALASRALLARTLATAPSLLDVTYEIKLDHDNVRDLFERYKHATSPDEKGVIANTLIREMAIHSDAEEVSVYNDYGALGLADTAAHNKDEHAEVKKLVYAADSTAVSSPNYDEVLAKAVNGFLAHAREEEEEQFAVLKSKLSSTENDRIARDFLKARMMAPKRPHPWAPQTGGIAQKAAALQGKAHDTVVETLGNRKFTDLKYKHPENF